MKRTTCAALFAASLLGACGGGGGASPAPPATAQGTSAFTSQNYLDATWIAIIAFDRIETAAEVIDAAYTLALVNGDVSGTYNCAGGGDVIYARTGNNRQFTANQCRTVNLADVTTYRSGTLVTNDAVVAQAGNFTYLASANIALSNAVVDFSTTNPISNRTGDESFSGAVAVAGTATQVSGSGTLTVTRAGRADAYTQIAVAGPQADEIDFDLGTFGVSTPRFPSSFTVQFNAATLTATLTGPDTSRLNVALAPGSTDTLRFTILNSAGQQTFTSNVQIFSMESLAARTRALQ